MKNYMYVVHTYQNKNGGKLLKTSQVQMYNEAYKFPQDQPVSDPVQKAKHFQ